MASKTAPARVPYEQQVRERLGGQIVGPTAVARAVGTDRAYACRLLQKLVLRSRATKLPEHGKYRVHLAKGKKKA